MTYTECADCLKDFSDFTLEFGSFYIHNHAELAEVEAILRRLGADEAALLYFRQRGTACLEQDKMFSVLGAGRAHRTAFRTGRSYAEWQDVGNLVFLHIVNSPVPGDPSSAHFKSWYEDKGLNTKLCEQLHVGATTVES